MPATEVTDLVDDMPEPFSVDENTTFDLPLDWDRFLVREMGQWGFASKM
jgi:hypothetical protein